MISRCLEPARGNEQQARRLDIGSEQGVDKPISLLIVSHLCPYVAKWPYLAIMVGTDRQEKRAIRQIIPSWKVDSLVEPIRTAQTETNTASLS